MPFGLRNAAQTLQRQLSVVYIYLNDIQIASSDEVTHLVQLEEVLRRLEAAHLTISPGNASSELSLWTSWAPSG